MSEKPGKIGTRTAPHNAIEEALDLLTRIAEAMETQQAHLSNIADLMLEQRNTNR